MTTDRAPEHRRTLRVAGTLAAIVGTAALLRMIGLSFGLPAVYNPDEVAIMSRALAFAKGDLNPHNFLYPTFYFYLLFVWVGASYVVGHLVGAYASLASFQTRFFVDPTNIYLAGRLLSVVTGCLGVVAAYALARRLSDRIAGLSAATMLAVAPFHVRDSHYVKHEVAATLAIVCAMIAIVWVAERPLQGRRRFIQAAVAAMACGAAVSTHYYAVFVILPLTLVLLIGPDPLMTKIRLLVLAGCSTAAVFFVLSPFVLLDWTTAVRDITANRQIVVDRAMVGQAGVFSNAAVYAAMLWRDAIGQPVVVLAAAGAAIMAITAWKRALVLLAFPVAFLLFISNTVPATRYLTPVLPMVAVLAGVGVSALARLARRRRVTIAAVLVGMASLPGLGASLTDGLFFRQTDTRTLALRYIERHVPAGSSIALQPYSVPLIQSRESLRESLRATLGDERRASTKFALRLALDPYPGPAYRLIFIGDGGLDADKIYVSARAFDVGRGVEPLRSAGVAYVVMKRYNTVDPGSMPLFKALANEADLLASFSPYRAGATPGEIAAAKPFLHNADARITGALERPGPVVDIWRLRVSAR